MEELPVIPDPAAEAEIGIFWTEHTGQQYARAFSYLVNNYNLGTADSARLMAMLWTGYADAAIEGASVLPNTSMASGGR